MTTTKKITGDWIEFNKPFFEGDDSFCDRRLNKPGTLVETEFGIYLIGDTGYYGGISSGGWDDSPFEIKYDDIVKRYKVVWDCKNEEFYNAWKNRSNEKQSYKAWKDSNNTSKK